MTEDYPVKIDKIGRIVLPKKIRNKYKYEKKTVLKIIECDNYILLKKEEPSKEKIIKEKIDKIKNLYPEIEIKIEKNEINQNNDINYDEIKIDKYTKIVIKKEKNKYKKEISIIKEILKQGE